MRHSHTAMYLATMSPRPAHSMRMGAWASMSVSSSMPSGTRVYSDTFTSFISMAALLEA